MIQIAEPRVVDDERQLRVIRKSRLIMARTLAFGLAGLIGVILVEVAVPNHVPGFSIDATGVKLFSMLVFLIVLGIAVVMELVRWFDTVYVLTDHRVVVRHGIVNHTVESIPLDSVRDAIVRQNAIARLLHLGDVHLETAGRQAHDVVVQIENPEEFSGALLRARDEYISTSGAGHRLLSAAARE
jgi:uncharacterized membrane protein YdbT with pleckstrin-like domain